MSAQPLIIHEVTGPVTTITLNRPEAKNSLSPELVDGLARRLIEAETDDRVRVIVLTNTGTTFCAGADLKAARPGIADPDEPGDSPGNATSGIADSQPAVADTEHYSFVDLFRLILDGTKPVVARVDGHATGGGVGLVAACDLSVMRSDALIGFTEVRIGVAPAIISVVCLPKLSRADASELFLTGERISADRAAQVGLINRSVEPADLDDAVGDLVDKLLAGGPRALAASKELIRRVPSMERDDALGWTERLSRDLFAGDEARAGIAAFRERRPAPWSRL